VTKTYRVSEVKSGMGPNNVCVRLTRGTESVLKTGTTTNYWNICKTNEWPDQLCFAKTIQNVA
jgi:hypothetical protein